MNLMMQKRGITLLKEKHSTSPAALRTSEFGESFHKEAAFMAGVGIWSIDLNVRSIKTDEITRHILKISPDFPLFLSNVLPFFKTKFRKKILQAFFEVKSGLRYDGFVNMLTSKDESIWVKIGIRPVFNDNEQVIGLKGILQDITEMRTSENDLKKSLKSLTVQNSGLIKFTDSFSHSLRSQASNLQLTLELLQSTESKKDEIELMQGLGVISNNLNLAINDFNEFAGIISKAKEPTEKTSFRNSLLLVQRSIQNIIFNEEVEIYSDFSELNSIKYIPTILENILRNLVIYAIISRHPERKAIIDVCTYEVDGSYYLMIKDNGIGVDLTKVGDQIFNINQQDQDQIEGHKASLFLVKTQVEIMGGSINVESTPGVGTKFTIRF